MITRTARCGRYAIACALMLAPLHSLPARAADCMAASDAHRVAVLELYTSEGCDSCPPADKWVSALPARGLRAERVVPLAFHVDYWNQLGWVDPFSQAAFSARQRAHSVRRGVSFVVTPQLLLNGQDYRRGDDIDTRIRAINLAKPRADIRVGMSHQGALLQSRIEVDVAGGAEERRAQVFVALYENNLASAVRAGENRGQTLKHDFVVRSLIGPLALDDRGHLIHAQSFPLDGHWKPADLNLAVFVQHPASGDILQALSTACH